MEKNTSKNNTSNSENERVERSGSAMKGKKVIKKGVVVSDIMDKTIVVRVDTLKTHPRYKKKVIVSKKYKVHDEENKYVVGDRVSFVNSRPISKDKTWVVI